MQNVISFHYALELLMKFKCAGNWRLLKNIQKKVLLTVNLHANFDILVILFLY